MIIHNVEQKSEAWYELRKFRLTGSHAQEIGNCGKGLETYIIDVLASSYAISGSDGYTNENIDRGNILEPEARDVFSFLTGKEVKEVGFIEYNEYVGTSPDGIIPSENGMIEIKCHNNTKHFKFILNREKEIESKYMWQMQMNMLVGEFDHCYYVAYNPNFKESLLYYKILPDEKMREKLLEGFKKGEEMIKDLQSKVEKNENIKN